MKKQYVTDFKTKEEPVNDLFAVKEKRSIRPYKFGTMFTLLVSDKMGEIILNYFGGEKKEEVEKLYSSFEKQDVIQVIGKVDDFSGITISVNPDSGKIEKVEEFDAADFMPVSKQDPEKMKSELLDVISKIEDPDIKKLLENFFNNPEFLKEYSEAAAASSLHHSFKSGLIEHVLSMIKIANVFVEQHPELNKDLLIAGCIFHDIGKVKELKAKTAIEYTDEGLLLGHISMGQKMVSDAIEKLENFPEIIKNKIIHMILSHHGTKDKGSPVEPLTPEAEALHHIDMLDSQVQKVLQNKEKTNPNDKWLLYKGWPTLYLE